jgi:hypothetical protein
MLRGELPTEVEVEAFNKALILHADHELNASAFTARCAVFRIRFDRFFTVSNSSESRY